MSMQTTSRTSNGVKIIERRKLWYGISLVVLIPATIVLIIFGLRLGIDFTGGSDMEIQGRLGKDQVEQIVKANHGQNVTVTTSGIETTFVRYRLQGDNAEADQKLIEADLSEKGGKVVSLNQVGPSVSNDLTKNALLSISVMSLAIIFYITYVFRKVPAGVSALSFGVTAIQALVHDALFVLGVFALLGELAHVEVDAYIVTAILTVIGFSVHDTIVVFDRIRENLDKSDQPFAKVVNSSLQETLVRSLNTSLVVVMVLLALFLFGGASTRYFVLALLLGMVSGTYSSIFIASPLLVDWNNFTHRSRKAKKA